MSHWRVLDFYATQRLIAFYERTTNCYNITSIYHILFKSTYLYLSNEKYFIFSHIPWRICFPFESRHFDISLRFSSVRFRVMNSFSFWKASVRRCFPVFGKVFFRSLRRRQLSAYRDCRRLSQVSSRVTFVEGKTCSKWAFVKNPGGKCVVYVCGKFKVGEKLSCQR